MRCREVICEMVPASVAFISRQLSSNPKDGVSVYNANMISRLRELGVKVYEIWPKRTLMGMWPLYHWAFYNVSSFRQTMRLYKQNRIKIIHSTMADGVLLSFHKILPYVLTIHGVVADEIEETELRMLSLLRKRFDELLLYNLLIEGEKLSARNADIIIVPSEYSKHKAILHYQISPKKIVVIPHGINIGEFNSQAVNDDVRRNSLITILFVGRLTHRKGLIYLLNVAHSLSKQYLLELRIVGDGPERKTLQQYCIRKKISFAKFLGNLSRKETVKEYMKCDIFCLPSLHEGFGLVLLEAMAAKKPVVATHVGGVPEVIQDGKTGILVPPRNEGALADALERLIIDKNLRVRMGLEGYKRALSYTWDKSAQKVKQIYESL